MHNRIGLPPTNTDDNIRYLEKICVSLLTFGGCIIVLALWALIIRCGEKLFSWISRIKKAVTKDIPTPCSAKDYVDNSDLEMEREEDMLLGEHTNQAATLLQEVSTEDDVVTGVSLIGAGQDNPLFRLT